MKTNKTLMGGWISTAMRVFRREMLGENLLGRFEDWIYKECRKTNNLYYKNFYKLMKLALKLLNCRLNMTFFIKNHKILFSYFEENEEQIPWKHSIYCDCETCSSYFTLLYILLIYYCCFIYNP